MEIKTRTSETIAVKHGVRTSQNGDLSSEQWKCPHQRWDSMGLDEQLRVLKVYPYFQQ
jgi:hypothetical protein